MPRGDKSAYTGKQKRKAAHIEEGYRERGVPKDEAERRAWATVNKDSGGGNRSGSGRGRPDTNASARKGGKRGGTARLVAGSSARQCTPTRREEGARKQGKRGSKAKLVAGPAARQSATRKRAGTGTGTVKGKRTARS